MKTVENVCEHGDHEAPKGFRFCSMVCQGCQAGAWYCPRCYVAAWQSAAEAQRLRIAQKATNTSGLSAQEIRDIPLVTEGDNEQR
jgi:hypothetical protein